MQAALYLLIGLAVMGGLFWLLMQITARQRRLDAELTRLERLAAEVAMNAEALLEQVDERMDQLHDLLAVVEAKAAPREAVPREAAPREATPAPGKRGRRRKQKEAKPAPPEPSAAAQAAGATEAAPEPAPDRPGAPGQKYQELRPAVWALADQGKDPGAIAQELGIPRGEVILMLNLRSRKVTA
jgi:hypothetical protein